MLIVTVLVYTFLQLFFSSCGKNNMAFSNERRLSSSYMRMELVPGFTKLMSVVLRITSKDYARN